MAGAAGLAVDTVARIKRAERKDHPTIHSEQAGRRAPVGTTPARRDLRAPRGSLRVVDQAVRQHPTFWEAGRRLMLATTAAALRKDRLALKLPRRSP